MSDVNFNFYFLNFNSNFLNFDPARLAINAPTSATFRITDTKLSALIVTL